MCFCIFHKFAIHIPELDPLVEDVDLVISAVVVVGVVGSAASEVQF